MTPLEIVGIISLVLVLIIVVLLGVVFFSLPKRIPLELKGAHAFVTGGSKGIGREIAAELLRRGIKTVSIAARNVASLKEAKELLDSSCKENQQILTFALDITAGFDEINNVIKEAETKAGPIDILINNAGFCVQAGFDELPTDSFLDQMKINYVGAAHVTRAVISGMKTRRRGHICFVSSAAGQCAIWGYAAYSPSKFALRGLADTLHMELQPHHVTVSVLYPPNTDTEGFAVEQETVPEATRQISGAAGFFPPRDVARATVTTIANGGFSTTVGFEGWMLGTLTAGASPEPSFIQALAQLTFGGIFRAIMLVYVGSFNRIVQNLHDDSPK